MTSLFEGLSPLLGENTNNNAQDPAVRLAQGGEPLEPELFGLIGGKARLGNQLQHTNKLIGHILVIEEHAGNLSSQSRRSGTGAVASTPWVAKVSSERSCAGGC